MIAMGSDISGFYALSVEERIRLLRKQAGISAKEAAMLRKSGALGLGKAEMMVENVIGTTQLPVGIATNFLINGKDYLVPMAIEEPSVVAAASYAAKLARKGFLRSQARKESRRLSFIGGSASHDRAAAACL